MQVEPFSVKHKYDGKWDPEKPELKTCNPSSMKFVTEKDTKQEVKEGEEIIFSYDVAFKVILLFGKENASYEKKPLRAKPHADGFPLALKSPASAFLRAVRMLFCYDEHQRARQQTRC